MLTSSVIQRTPPDGDSLKIIHVSSLKIRIVMKYVILWYSVHLSVIHFFIAYLQDFIYCTQNYDDCHRNGYASQCISELYRCLTQNSGYASEYQDPHHSFPNLQHYPSLPPWPTHNIPNWNPPPLQLHHPIPWLLIPLKKFRDDDYPNGGPSWPTSTIPPPYELL